MNKFQKKMADWLGFSALVDAANWQYRYQRPPEPQTVNAIAKEVPMGDWLTLVSDSRKLYSNLGPAKGAINDKAVYSVGRAWDPKFQGKDQAWGAQATAWLKAWYRVADVRGGMFDFKTDLNVSSISVDRDGEIYILLTETATGWPQIQLIPATLIGNRGIDTPMSDGPYKGLKNIQGIIYNENGQAVAYQVLGENPDDDEIYSALNLIQIFDPEWADQVRGFPAFTHALLDLKDLRTIQGNENMVSAICSTIGIIESNEMGAPDPNDPANFLRKNAVATNTGITGGPQMTVQNFAGVVARYFRAGAGSKLEQLKLDRPGEVWEQFMNRLIRNACVGAGWPYELTWDSSQLGGANVRLLLARAMRTVEDRQDLLRPVARRIVGYAVAKAIKLGILPANDEWYAWDFSLPARISVDYGRDANADREDYLLGLTNMGDILEEEGKDLVQHIAERKAENDMLEAAGLPIYGPGAKSATDLTAEPPEPAEATPFPSKVA